MPSPKHDYYSAVADQQLNEMEASDLALYDDVLTTCERIFDNPGLARSVSSAITTPGGIRMVLDVPGRYPFKVFWSPEPVRIEAVFPYEQRSR